MKEIKLSTYNLTLLILNKECEEDFEYVKSRKDEIFKILKTSYEDIGGCEIYRNVKHMLRNVDRYKIVINDINKRINISNELNFNNLL